MHLRAISLPIKPEADYAQRPAVDIAHVEFGALFPGAAGAQHLPARSRRRDSASIIAIACSDTGIVPRPGLFTTATPRAVQAATSMESVPRPEEATIDELAGAGQRGCVDAMRITHDCRMRPASAAAISAGDGRSSSSTSASARSSLSASA